eukprot:4528729-Amphidinium_carterae.1
MSVTGDMLNPVLRGIAELMLSKGWESLLLAPDFSAIAATASACVMPDADFIALGAIANRQLVEGRNSNLDPRSVGSSWAQGLRVR